MIAKGDSNPFVTVAVPYGVPWPLEETQTATISIGNNVMVAEGYHLKMECRILRANPKPSIVWHFGDNIIQGPQYTVEEDGTLVINGVTRDRDEGVYICIADTPNVGQDQSSTTVIVTGELVYYDRALPHHLTFPSPVPPRINSSELVTNPGNCLDLTQSLVNTQPVGVDLCLRAGEEASITLQCNIEEGSPAPTIQWLKDGVAIDGSGDESLVIHLPIDAYGEQKKHTEGNYTCHAFNVAGSTTMETHISVFGGTVEMIVIP